MKEGRVVQASDRNLYVPLGDSITCGFAASHAGHTFVTLLGDRLQQAGFAEDTRPVARPGWTSMNLWQAVQRVPDDVWARANVVTLLIGGNDLRRRYYTVFTHPAPHLVLDRAIDSYSFALGRICGLLAQQGIPHVVMGTVYNPLPNAPLAVRAISRLNHAVRSLADRHGFAVADTYTQFLGNEPALIHRYRTGRLEDLSLPFARPIHPNDAGHQVIADCFWEALERRLTVQPGTHVRRV